MTQAQWAKLILSKPALYFPVLRQVLAMLRLKYNRIATRHYDGDPEQILFKERAGWIFSLEPDALHEAFRSLPFETRRGKMLDKDAPYSCSMRLIRLVYFIRLQDPVRRDTLLAEFAPHAAADAEALASAPEYRRATVLFSNHLLQNYCALLLYHTHFKGHPGFINTSSSIAQVESWLSKDWDVLFRGRLSLYEGSSSYETLLLPILCNIACCGYNSALTAKIRSQLASDAVAIAREYVIDGTVVMPHIGDITPDYADNVMRMFVETFAFRKDTPYRRIWHEELQTLGL